MPRRCRLGHEKAPENSGAFRLQLGFANEIVEIRKEPWRVALVSHFAPELEGFHRNAETSSSVGNEKILYPEKNAGQIDRSPFAKDEGD